MGKRKPGTKVRPRELEEVKALLKSGKSIAAIKDATGISKSKVYQIRRDYTPQLHMRCPSVEVWTDRRRIGRYATVGVAATSKVEAAACQAWVEVLPSGRRLPLHWAGPEYTPEESSAPRITISLEKPARLDVAFALPPPGEGVPRAVSQGAIVSGQVTAMKFGDGVQYVPTEPWKGEGCWLATPGALYNPDPRHEAYCKPGEYRIKVTVDSPDGKGDSREFTLLSPASWGGLELNPV